MDAQTNLEELKKKIQDFCEARDWDPFHGAKDLAIGAVTESSELLEIFRFLSEDQVEAKLKNSEARTAIGQELADVMFFLLRFAQRYDFSLSEEIHKKMELNERRYPASEFKGQNHKSTIKV